VYITDDLSEDIYIEENISPSVFYSGVDAVKTENVGVMTQVARNIVSELQKKESIYPDMQDLRSFDDYTYHHSVNVAIYATIVGRKLGLTDEKLEQLCMAALCHDLGKRMIPVDILNKPGKLTDEEFKLIKTHSTHSYEILDKNFGVDSVIKQAALLHHENENGSGYPYGKEGADTPLLARIIHAVDVYDALTSKRPYKDPFSPADAINYMIGGKQILFGTEIVDAMVASIPAFPPGIDVSLSNGEKAIVMEHTNQATRPVVRIIETRNIVNLATDAKYASIEITQSGFLPTTPDGKIAALNETRLTIPKKVGDKTILIVDDMVTSLMTAKNAIGDTYKTVLAKSGLQALEYFRKNGSPDLMIVDIDMPGMNGVTTVKTIQEKYDRNVPVIFLTSISNKDIVLTCKKLGAKDYILKPANSFYLKERVAIALGDSISV